MMITVWFTIFFTGNVKIYKNENTVAVEVPELGLKQVTFDGVNLKVLHLLSRLLLPFCLVLAHVTDQHFSIHYKDVLLCRLRLLRGWEERPVEFVVIMTEKRKMSSWCPTVGWHTAVLRLFIHGYCSKNPALVVSGSGKPLCLDRLWLHFPPAKSKKMFF